MKNAKLILSVTSLLIVGGLVSCGESTNNDTLNIICLDASYGDKWINSLVEQFEASNPNIKVNLKTSSDANVMIEKNLNSKKNTDDLYISVGSSWKTNAASGKFEELDSLLQEEVDDVTIENKVVDEYKKSLYFTKSDGTQHCYRLPWTSGIGGIYYNSHMFEEYGWSDWLKTTFSTNTSGIPETFNELLSLCDKINIDRIPVSHNETEAVKPFVYTGANSDYFDYLTLSWWGQLAGVENIQEFLKYESVNNYDTSKNETYNCLKQATSYWNQIFGNSNNVVSGCEAATAEGAQKLFFNGAAAMMVNGDWLYNDFVNGYNIENFNLKLMKTPLIEGAKYGNTSYVIGEDQYIAIPKTAPHKDYAKSFIKLMVSNTGCNTFLNEANGFLAYKCDYSSNTNSYIESAIDVRKSYTSTFTSFSNNRKYLCNYIDVWCTSALRPYSSLLNKSNTLDSAFNEIASTARQGWDLWTSKSN